MRSSGLAPSFGANAMPMLAPAVTLSEYIVRFSKRSHQAFGQLRCLSFACGAVLEDCKFIAAEASHEIGIPQDLAQTLGNVFSKASPTGCPRVSFTSLK
jgi:hypothetical protein